MTTGTSSRVRESHVDEMTKSVAELCENAAHVLPDDVVAGLQKAEKSERRPLGLLCFLQAGDDVVREDMCCVFAEFSDRLRHLVDVALANPTGCSCCHRCCSGAPSAARSPLRCAPPF